MKKSLIQRIGSTLAFLLILVVILLLAFVIISGVKVNVAFIGGYAVMWVKTESMSPLIPARSYILVKEAEASEVNLDDVIVFHSDDPALAGAYNTHRVVGIVGNKEEFITRGDHNNKDDDYTAKADKVVGVYKSTLSTLSVFGRFLSTPIGMTAAGAIVLALLMAVYVPDMKRAAAAQEAEAEKKKQAEIERLIREEVEKLKASGIPVPPAPEGLAPDTEIHLPPTGQLPDLTDDPAPGADQKPDSPEDQAAVDTRNQTEISKEGTPADEDRSDGENGPRDGQE